MLYTLTDVRTFPRPTSTTATWPIKLQTAIKRFPPTQIATGFEKMGWVPTATVQTTRIVGTCSMLPMEAPRTKQLPYYPLATLPGNSPHFQKLLGVLTGKLTVVYGRLEL